MQASAKKKLRIFSYFFISFLVWLFLANMWSPNKKIRFDLDVEYGIQDPQFRATVSSMLGPPLIQGNQITAYANGDEIFPAMLSEIAKAKTSITLEAFIFWDDHVGAKFRDALIDRAKNGVKVNILVDWLGSRKLTDQMKKEMEEAGIRLYFFRPLRWYHLDRMNHRSHRRILVIDGHVGFTGGVGIADDWSGDGLQPEKWKDTQFKVVGPVVSQLQAAFSDNWMRTQDDVLHGGQYFPPTHDPENAEASAKDPGVLAQMFRSSSREGSSSARFLFLYSISAARKSIDISAGYFIPDNQSVEELIKAKKRGVRVRILAPSEKTDSQIVLKASHATWGPILEAGVEMWTYTPAMLHDKIMIVDGIWSSVGSTNFDPRSFRLNDEANLNIYDEGFAQQQTARFEKDLLLSEKISPQKWQERPWFERATDLMLLTLKPQL